MVTRANVKPALITWARERAGIPKEELSSKFKNHPRWEEGDLKPTLKQLDAFASAVHVPVGYLFLSKPPKEVVPIPDFRTVKGRSIARPSPNLLDTIYICQERQAWYRDYARMSSLRDLDFVASVSTTDSPQSVAEQIRDRLGFDLESRKQCRTWSDALRFFIRQADSAGILVMVSGIVMNNSRRPLEPEEFRGFALCDSLAPLIFVNGRDTKAAQMFTVAHELAHIWLGTSALSNLGPIPQQSPRIEERWCNSVASELLVPINVLRSHFRGDESLNESLSRLARIFKVSTLVILLRFWEEGLIAQDDFDITWKSELDRLQKYVRAGDSGGNFYRTTLTRVSPRFARALVSHTLEGQTLYRDAFRMLGIQRTATFEQLAREVGVAG